MQHHGEHAGQRAGPPRRVDLPGRDRVQQAQRVLAQSERRLPFGGGVERRAEGEDVGLRPGVTADGHLGGEVGGRSRDHPRLGHGDVVLGAGDPEVGDLHEAVVGEQDVAWLDVAVHDADVVCLADRGGDLRADPRHLQRRQRALLLQHLRQAGGVEKLHDQARLAVLVGHHVEDRDRVRVVQPRGDPALAHGALPGVLGLVRVEARLEHQLFDRHRAMQHVVVRLPHGAHGTGPDPLDDTVAAGDQATLVAHATSFGLAHTGVRVPAYRDRPGQARPFTLRTRGGHCEGGRSAPRRWPR